MEAPKGEIEYLSTEDILTLHEVIVENSGETESGISDRGDIEYTVEHIQEGHFGQRPTTLHEKAFQLMRLLVANHPFVDGNKRTALASTVAFYALNGYDLDYDSEIKKILKHFATDEASVDQSEVIDYLEENSSELPEEYTETYQVLADLGKWNSTQQWSEQNDYADGDSTKE